jgi:hypothetical protein
VRHCSVVVLPRIAGHSGADGRLLVKATFPGVAPPDCVAAIFVDVPCSHPFADYIYQLVDLGVTAGCGGGRYCPDDSVTRDQMAVFLMKMLLGGAFSPSNCTVAPFADVPCSSIFARWIRELVTRGITAGCGAGIYCPTRAVTRGEMAVFLVRTFNLTP